MHSNANNNNVQRHITSFYFAKLLNSFPIIDFDIIKCPNTHVEQEGQEAQILQLLKCPLIIEHKTSLMLLS